MRVLIIENETYLAQSIVNKLSDFGFECEVVSNIIEMEKLAERKKFDVVIASFSAIEGDYLALVRTHSEAIIILLVPYANDDTIIKPLQSGITDYIIKPFITEELARKIKHYKSYKDLKSEVEFYCNYFSFVEKELSTPNPISYNPSFIIKTNSQRSADIYAMRYARMRNIKFEFLTLKEERWRQLFKSQPNKNKVFYITNLEELNKTEMKEFLELIGKCSCIVSIVSNEAISFPQVVDISSYSSAIEIGGDILSIKEYEKIIIAKFENRYPDVELAKKLGMSPKSLWEKRKKYGLMRKKEFLD
ncbi:response regulator [Helicobacter sp. 23-1048]